MPHEDDVRRTLVLVRHATAASATASDHARALTPAGRGLADRVGQWLAAQGVVPDQALVSDAARTQETWHHVATAAGWSAAPTSVGALYTSGPEAVLDLVRETSDEVACLLVLGHNPTVASLAELLDDGRGDEAAVTGLVTSGYPPGTVTVLGFTGSWATLAEASVVAFRSGRS